MILLDDEGAAGISSFNTSPFFEDIDIVPGPSNILLDDFTFVDVYGSNIPAADWQTDMTMTVVDGNGTSVYSNDVNTTSYFTLVKTDTNLQNYNIFVTQDFMDAVYFGDDANLRNFVFTFQAAVRDNPVSSFDVNAALGNIAPVIQPSQGDGDVGNYSRSVSTIMTRQAGNGADDTEDKDRLGLDWDIQTGNDNGYFSMSNDTTWQSALTNNFPGSIPIQQYNLTIRVTDAGGSEDSVVVGINFEANITECYALEFRTDQGGAGGTDYTVYDTVLIRVEDWNNSVDGWYIFNSTFSEIGGSSTEKTVVNTGANTGSTCTGKNPLGEGWWYSSTSLQDVKDIYRACNNTNADPYQWTQGANIDITNIKFTIG